MWKIWKKKEEKVEQKKKVEEIVLEEINLKEINLKESEEKVEEKKVEEKKFEEKFVEIKKDVEKKEEDIIGDKFNKELELLKSMGFANEILNLHLLYKFNGKVEKVVEMLLKIK